MHRTCSLIGLVFLSLAPPVWAQAWSTTWHVVSEDGSELTGDRVAHGQTFGGMLEQSGAWFRSMGFRAPDMERSPQDASAYLARVKDNTADISSGNNWVGSRSPANRMRLTGNLGMSTPSTPTERLMWASPVHELFHAVQNAYPSYISGAFSDDNLRVLTACVPEPDLDDPGSDTKASAWISEGMAAAVQIRWMERQGRPYAHPFKSPGHASWMRFFDQSLHNPNTPAEYRATAMFNSERSAGRSWRCGYGTWYFWYAAGDMLAVASGINQEVEYLRYILGSPANWDDGGIAAVDDGLKEAARVFDSSFRYDEGLYEVYPAFIAEYADDKRFYRQPEAIALRGRSEVKWHDGVIAPVSTTAFEVSINVDDNATQASRFIVTLDPQEHRDQLHLIAGRTVYPQGDALADEDPYSFSIPVRRDTTILVRLSNVAEEAADTEGLQYSIRFELGGFYGAAAADPYEAPDVDIPPGFNVMSGPPSLVGCQSGPEGGSVFDLITAAEAVGDIRRAEDGANQTLADMDEALEDGEFPMPNATPEQRAAMKRMIESGAISQAQIAQMRAAIAESQAKMEQIEPDMEQARNEMASEYRDRSRLIANFVGTTGGTPCQVILAAGLRGEEGGAQQLSVADGSGRDSEDPLAVGIESVGYAVGASMAEMMQRMDQDDFSVCMMTPEEQARDRQSSCPRGCSGGSLTLEEASQGHAKGTLRVDLIRQLDAGPNARCPRIDRRELVVGFNITSANSGQDADMFRGISDEMFRMMGVDPAGMNMLRDVMNGRLFR